MYDEQAAISVFLPLSEVQLVPVDVQSVYGLSIFGVAGWNPAVGTDVRLLCLFVVKVVGSATS